MKNCQDCGKLIKDANTSGYCRNCLRKHHCPKCGQILGKKHACASVDLKGIRYCIFCNKELKKEGWEKRSNVCRLCSNRQQRKLEKEERKQIKEKFGNKCNRCGYSRCKAALHFHHLDNSHKDDFSKKGGANLRELRSFPKRFELLCACCHIEEHLPNE